MIFVLFKRVKLASFFPLSFNSVGRLIGLIAFYISQLSSFFRILFTWPFLKMVNNRNIDIIDTIGKTDPVPQQIFHPK
jgi:hypothetical protein